MSWLLPSLLSSSNERASSREGRSGETEGEEEFLEVLEPMPDNTSLDVNPGCEDIVTGTAIFSKTAEALNA
jgi:hypothetical protein